MSSIPKSSAPPPGGPPRVLVVGATSAIAHAVSRRYAARSSKLFLVGRREEPLRANAQDLVVRGAADVRVALLDVDDGARHDAVIDEAFAAWGGFDRVLLAHGVLPDQARCEQSAAAMMAAFHTNATSTLSLLTLIANRFEAQGHGAIGVISSPAADRGRASNYVYGSSKAAVSVFAAGLRHRLYRKGVRVITISPGFVDSPMTASFAKGALWASPERVANDIERALERSNGVVYAPGFWRIIMAIIRNVPDAVFLRTKL